MSGHGASRTAALLMMAAVSVVAVPTTVAAQSFLEGLARRTAENLADRAASAVERSVTRSAGPDAAPAPPTSPRHEEATASMRPRARAAASSRLPTDRFAPRNVLSFWQTHGTDAVTSDDPSARAPGFISAEPSLQVHQPRSGPRISQAEIDALRFPLEAAFEVLRVQPSVADIRGASLRADINISVRPTHDGRSLVVGILTLRAKKIILDHPSTQLVDGRYETPALEGDTLDVILNPYELIATRDVQSMARADRVHYVRAGSQMILLLADGPESTAWTPRRAADELASDRSWYTESPGEHPFAVTVKGPSHTAQALVSGQLDPAAPMARLAAAMFMVDWSALHAQLAGTRGLPN